MGGVLPIASLKHLPQLKGASRDSREIISLTHRFDTTLCTSALQSTALSRNMKLYLFMIDK